MSTFRIMTLDGGGLRGIYTATLLCRIEEAIPGFIDSVRLFAGTSTGGILALGLAHGITPERGVELYHECGAKVFADSLIDDLIDLGQIIGAQYSNRNLKKILTAVFDDDTLDDILVARGKFVLIPTFDLEAVKDGVRCWKPKFFHNFPGEDSDGAALAVDVALYTSAAPTYFPSHQGFVDGGVVANNPSMAALAQALDKDTGNQELHDIRLISFGTGYFPQYVGGKRHDWGFAQWAKPLVSIMLEGSMGVSDYQCKRLLGRDCYHRLAPALPRPIPLDDVDSLADLIRLANDVEIRPTLDWIEAHFA